MMTDTRENLVKIINDALLTWAGEEDESGHIADKILDAWEWEYGVRLHPDVEYKPNENLSTYTPPTTPHPSLQRAQEMADLNPRYRPTYHRRRKAGPWVPVEQDGA